MATTTITTTKKVMNKFARNAEIDEFLEASLTEAGYGGVDITTSPLGTRITLFVQRPGLVIGRRGMGIRDLTEKLEKKFGLPNPQISVVEEEVPELNPRIMCSRIAQTVVRGTAFRRAAIWAMNSMMNAGALGVEITISGKLRSERAHFEKYVAGVVPKSGETADRIVRRATTDVLLKMGLFGVKVDIAIKNSIPPDVELIELNAPASSETGEEKPEGDEAQEQNQKDNSAPRSSRRSSTSKKESKKGNETSQD
ncbi:MAG: 30S ribosomal protein S3 [Thaumarchaeota archaeon]|nr:30S ribosomal protein S3 [Nitrososphaerota archaeon]